MKVFLSYSHRDQKSARQIAEELSAAGIDVRYDQELLLGDNWAQRMGDALESADAMVVLISPNSVNSPWVERDIEYALGTRKYKGRLVPVLLRPTKEIPWILKRVGLVEASNNPGETGQRILEQLRQPVL